ncbi:MAG: hypothetical protein QM500_15600 [Methylococcales bacterium]
MNINHINNSTDKILKFDRALIVHKKWLDMIYSGIKIWEMRSRHTTIRERIGLIEADTGLVTGTTILVDSLGPLTTNEIQSNTDKHQIQLNDMQHPIPNKWNHAWVLKDSKKLTAPINYCHPKGAVIWVKFTDINF